MEAEGASLFQRLGAGGFGFLIGWNLYFVNRYRAGPVSLSDLAALVGTLGGTAVLALFPARTDLFGAYGIGLFAGFFGYLGLLLLFVRKSPNFSVDWFLDGRRKRPAADEIAQEADQTIRAMPSRQRLPD